MAKENGTRNSKRVAENIHLEKELAQAKLELKLERQNKFATPQQKAESTAGTEPSEEPPAAEKTKKRGAPVGHIGWFRPTPQRYDWLIEVPAPRRCSHCDGNVESQSGCVQSKPDSKQCSSVTKKR